MLKNVNCCSAVSCSLSVSFDFFVSPSADKPAGSSKTKLFPFGWLLHVIPFWGCVFVKDTHSWEWYRWQQIYCLPVWPSAAWISRGSYKAGPDTQLLNHALARTLFSPCSSSTLFHSTLLGILFHTLWNGCYYWVAKLSTSTHCLY